MSRTFTGPGSYAVSSSNFTIDPSISQTICAWIFPTAWDVNPRQVAGLISASGSLTVTTGTFAGSIVTAKATAATATAAANTLVLNTWQFIAQTFDASTGIVRLYLNGVEVSYASQTNHIGSAVQNKTWMVGNEAISGGSNGFEGSIDTVAEWNTKLTAPQLVTAMRYQGPASLPTNLAAYWPLLGVTSPEPQSPVNTFPLTVGSAVQGANSPGQTPLIISGALGAAGAGATVFYSGAASGNVTADGSGNYSIPGLIVGTYTITPSLAGHQASPPNMQEIVTTSNITGVNFTIFTPSASGSNSKGIQTPGSNFATQIISPNTSVVGTNLHTEIRK